MKNLISYKNVLDFSLFRAEAIFENKKVKYNYKFTPEGKLEGLKNREKTREILLNNLKDKNKNNLRDKINNGNLILKNQTT